MATSPRAEATTELGPMLPVPYRLVRKRSETHDTWTIELEPADDRSLERFAPGQFGMLYRFGVGEAPISISGGGTGAHGALVHTIRAVGPVSKALCAAPRGEVIGVRGPFGTGWPMTELEGADVLVVGGGIGIAPLRPVMLHLVAHRERYGNVALLYGGRSPRELLYGRDLERWGGRYDVQVDVQVTVDSADSGWLGRVGLVTDLIPHARFEPAETAAFVVGPELMMRVTVDALQQQGIGSERIWLSLELNMKCAIGHCGHCQLGPEFICKDGPVFRHDRIRRFLGVREL